MTEPRNQVCLEHERVTRVRDVCSGIEGSGAAVDLPDWSMTQISTNVELQNPESQEQKNLLPTPSQSASTATVQDTKLAVLNIFPSATHPTFVISIYNMPLKF